MLLFPCSFIITRVISFGLFDDLTDILLPFMIGNNQELIESGPEVIKLFLCSTQLSMKFQMLISIKISRNSAFVRLR